MKGLIEIQKDTKNLIKSPINYTGGKIKLLPQIIPLFPNEIDTFYDVFGGGANVGINMDWSNKIIINDIDTHVIQLFNYIQHIDYDCLLNSMKNLINEYHLSNTTKNGYEYYECDTATGLSPYNKSHYTELRTDFNNKQFHNHNENLVFYLLLVFGFNNQIRFNKSGKFNTTIGKRDFNRNMEKKLFLFKNQIDSLNIDFINKDYMEFLSFDTPNNNDFVYFDPPY